MISNWGLGSVIGDYVLRQFRFQPIYTSASCLPAAFTTIRPLRSTATAFRRKR